jgi:hypothetical protein
MPRIAPSPNCDSSNLRIAEAMPAGCGVGSRCLCREQVAFTADESGPAIKSLINAHLDNHGHLHAIEEEEGRIDRIDPSDGTISVVTGYERKAEKDCIHEDEATKA